MNTFREWAEAKGITESDMSIARNAWNAAIDATIARLPRADDDDQKDSPKNPDGISSS